MSPEIYIYNSNSNTSNIVIVMSTWSVIQPFYLLLLSVALNSSAFFHCNGAPVVSSLLSGCWTDAHIELAQAILVFPNKTNFDN